MKANCASGTEGLKKWTTTTSCRAVLLLYFLAGILIFCMNMGCAAIKEKSSGLLLAKDGAPAATIVIDKEANRSARFAAVELRHHIEKITGAKLPIATDEDKIKGTRILVGESKATRALGLRDEDFKHQEYLIRFLPDTLILIGRDKEDKRLMDYAKTETFPGLYEEQATCYAVYDFLERYCGLRWYLPTDVGLICPKEKTLFVKGADVRRAPAMKYRLLYERIAYAARFPATLTDIPGPVLPLRERMLFARRQRLTGIQPFACNHAFYGYYKLHLKDHPEWFAKGYDKDMPEGMRDKPVGKWAHNAYPLYYPNMCYTDKGFISNVVKRAK